MHHRVLDASSAPAQEFVERLAGVVHHMEPIRNLDGFGRSLPSCIRERASAISHEDLHARMFPQPRRDRLGLVAVEQIDAD